MNAITSTGFLKDGLIVFNLFLTFYLLHQKGPTAGFTGKRGDLAARKLTDAESAIGAATLKVRPTARTCPVHAVLGAFCLSKYYALEARLLFLTRKSDP
jgi:hypothetical protein